MQGIANRTKIHQNKYAFAHNPNSKKSARIMGIPNVGLCQRCHDIIEWRKKFRKYKPIKNMTKCANCQEKKVRSAYHLWCTDCARATDVCPKCLLNRDIIEQEAAELTQESIHELFVQVGMKERVRRKIWRLWENDKATDAEIKDMILNYNPDAKEEVGPEDDEEEKAAKLFTPAAVAARGPPPKPKSSATASSSAAASTSTPASSSSSTVASSTSSVAKPATSASTSSKSAKKQEEEEEDEDFEDENDEDFEDGDEEDFEDDEEEEDEAAAEKARQLALKRGPAPKPKSATPAAKSTGLESAMESATIQK